MKLLFVLTVSVLLITGSIFSQEKWKNVKQKFFRIKYELPSDWYVNEFSSLDKNSNICTCSGTLNGSLTSDILMVIYPSSRNGLKEMKRQMLWEYVVMPSEDFNTINTKYFSFKKSITELKGHPEVENKFDGYEVLQLTGNYNDDYFIIYFVAQPDTFNKYSGTVDRIINSFKHIK